MEKHWKVEVIADNSGKWVGNGLRFEHEAEAKAYGQDLAYRWTAVREWRVVKEGPALLAAMLNGRA